MKIEVWADIICLWSGLVLDRFRNEPHPVQKAVSGS